MAGGEEEGVCSEADHDVARLRQSLHRGQHTPVVLFFRSPKGVRLGDGETDKRQTSPVLFPILSTFLVSCQKKKRKKKRKKREGGKQDSPATQDCCNSQPCTYSDNYTQSSTSRCCSTCQPASATTGDVSSQSPSPSPTSAVSGVQHRRRQSLPRRRPWQSGSLPTGQRGWTGLLCRNSELGRGRPFAPAS